MAIDGEGVGRLAMSTAHGPEGAGVHTSGQLDDIDVFRFGPTDARSVGLDDQDDLIGAVASIRQLGGRDDFSVVQGAGSGHEEVAGFGHDDGRVGRAAIDAGRLVPRQGIGG